MYLLGSKLSLQIFAFEGQNMKFTVNVLLTCIFYCGARLWLGLIRTVGKLSGLSDELLSLISYLSSNVLRRCRRFTSRKLCVCLEICLCCLQLSVRAYVSRAWYVCFIPVFDLSGTTWFECSCLCTSLLTVLRVVYAIVQLGSGKTMVSILYVDLISCRYF